MGIEENLERIATHLAAIADCQSQLLKVAQWNQARLGGSETAEPKADGPAEEPADKPLAPAEPVPANEWTYDALKAELLKRGVKVAKGTKMTTLLKDWEQHKNDSVVAPSSEAVPVVEAPAKPMTEEEARKCIMDKGYTGTPEQIVMMKKALASVGRATFRELVVGEYDRLIAEFDRLMEVK